MEKENNELNVCQSGNINVYLNLVDIFNNMTKEDQKKFIELIIRKINEKN